MKIIESTVYLTTTCILLFVSSILIDNSIRFANEELEKNKDLNKNLDLKVKERTQELNEKKFLLQDIEVKLTKYLPKQLVSSITSGKK